jgi:hypothetical protein
MNIGSSLGSDATEISAGGVAQNIRAAASAVNIKSGNGTLPKDDGKKAADISSIILDKRTNRLPSIIGSFRNSRLSTGYDEPTYLGFAIDIHSQLAESTNIYNPYTGLRSSPLFYLPKWAELTSNGSGITAVNDGKTFSQLLNHADEACAIQYLNSFSLPLSQTNDELAAKQVILKASADSTVTNRPPGELNRGFYLMEFIKVLNSIQEKTPWVFKELDGIPSLWQASNPGYKWEPIVLTLTCDETVDLRLTRLADTYRMLSYDSFNGRKILPTNLEKFSMDVYFMDLRFLKNSDSSGGIQIRLPGLGSSATYDENFAAQVNFGGVAFRCMGCRFDFSNFLENASQAKTSIGESGGFQPKIKIIVDRVVPATYFGDHAFSIAGFEDEFSGSTRLLGNALGGALNLGPFTGGVTRVLDAGRRALTNILGAPQRALNDALLGVQRRFEGAVDNFLGNSALSSRPFEKKSAEALINERGGNPIVNDVFPGTGGQFAPPIVNDVFPGADIRQAAPIVNDVFPGADTRTTVPIVKDIFPGVDARTARPIRGDVFPGSDKAVISDRTARPIRGDVFPGDVPIMKVINQRKTGGKIFSPNPLKP